MSPCIIEPFREKMASEYINLARGRARRGRDAGRGGGRGGDGGRVLAVAEAVLVVVVVLHADDLLAGFVVVQHPRYLRPRD